MGFVYLLCDSGQDNMFKIGVTKSTIEKRIKQLQTGNGSEIFLVDYYKTEHPFYLEKMLHKRFYSDKKLGEWFELECDKVNSFKDVCKQLEEIIEVMKDNPYFPKKLK